MASDQSSQSITVKLLIDSKGPKVLFAEAGKDFVDFLFTLLALPVGTVIGLLSSSAMVGSIGKLYDSFEALDNSYIQPHVSKDVLLKPKLSVASTSATILSLTNDTSSSGSRKLYYCSSCVEKARMYNILGSDFPKGSDDPKAICPSCNRNVNSELTYVAPPEVGSTEEGGFVKGVVSYMIMDDLEVRPISTISSITMLNKFNVKELGSLQEKTVSVNMNEGLKLLKASLQTESVLTSVFLGK